MNINCYAYKKVCIIGITYEIKIFLKYSNNKYDYG